MNLREDTIEVYREPHLGGYTEISRHSRGEDLRLARFPDVRVAVSALVASAPRPPKPLPRLC